MPTSKPTVTKTLPTEHPPQLTVEPSEQPAVKVESTQAKPKKPVKPKTLKPPSYSRGDIWYVTEPEGCAPVGNELWANRPAIIVSNDIANTHSGVVQVVYLTSSTNKRSSPTHVPTTFTSDSHKHSMALCEQIHTVSTTRLSRKLGTAPEPVMKQISQALAITLCLDHYPEINSLFKKWENYIKANAIDVSSEISNLTTTVMTERVSALLSTIDILAADRDAYKTLYENQRAMPEITRQLQSTSLANPINN